MATLAEIRTQAQQRSDMVNSPFITTAEWNSYINGSAYELYDLLIQKYGDDYFLAPPFEFTTDGTSDSYPLPDDFYKLRGVDIQVSNAPDGWATIKPFNFPERNRFGVPNLAAMSGVFSNLRYKIGGAGLMLIPRAAGGQVMRMWYVPRMVPLVADADVLDGVSGWEEYVIIDAIIKAKVKSEESIVEVGAQKMALIKRIEAAAENRDAAHPQTVSDTAYIQSGWSMGNPGGGWGI